MPERLSLKEFSELSFWEHLAYRENIDNAPWTTKACIDLVNDFSYRVKDHGFTEASYKKELLKDASAFKKDFKI